MYPEAPMIITVEGVGTMGEGVDTSLTDAARRELDDSGMRRYGCDCVSLLNQRVSAITANNNMQPMKQHRESGDRMVHSSD